MPRRVIEKHPVADFFARFLVGFAIIDVIALCVLTIAAMLHII